MKRKVAYLVLFLLLVGYTAVSHAQEANKLSKKEKQEGWERLFNGKDFSGWRQYNGTEMPKNWEIEEGAMKVVPANPSRLGQGAGGDIIFAGKNTLISNSLLTGKRVIRLIRVFSTMCTNSPANRSIMQPLRFRCSTTKMQAIIK